jgi:hypothetical protein
MYLSLIGNKSAVMTVAPVSLMDILTQFKNDQIVFNTGDAANKGL